jgi:hypothetical protein
MGDLDRWNALDAPLVENHLPKFETYSTSIHEHEAWKRGKGGICGAFRGKIPASGSYLCLSFGHDTTGLSFPEFFFLDCRPTTTGRNPSFLCFGLWGRCPFFF